MMPSRDVGSGELRVGGLEGDRQAALTRGASKQMPWYPHRAPVFNLRQVLVVSEDDCATIATQMGLPKLDAALICPNIVVSGIEQFSRLPPGTRLQFASGATIYVTDPNFPCHQIAGIIATALGDPGLAKRVVKAAYGYRGVMAMVEREGHIATGDRVTVVRNRAHELD